MKIQTSKLWLFVLVLIVVNLALFISGQARQSHHEMTVTFFDVGQGDAIHIRNQAGQDILIDGGPGDRVLQKLADDMPFLDRKIELLVITHPHADHVSGAVQILRRYTVEKVLVSDVEYPSKTYQAFLAEIEKQNVEVVRPRLGSRIKLNNGAVIDVLYPFVGYFTKTPKDPNSISTVLRLSYGKSNVLFTGDAGVENELEMIAYELPLQSEILKVGHQGSFTSSSLNFLKAVSPDFGVIMVGENSYGHPHQEVLDRLENQGIDIYRTDEKGDIKFSIFPDFIRLKKS